MTPPFGFLRVVRALRMLPPEREQEILSRLYGGDGQVYVEPAPRGAMSVTTDEARELQKRFVTTSPADPGSRIVASELGRCRWRGGSKKTS